MANEYHACLNLNLNAPGCLANAAPREISDVIGKLFLLFETIEQVWLTHHVQGAIFVHRHPFRPRDGVLEPIEATEQALQRAMGTELSEAFLKASSRLLIQLVDGLTIAWSAHGDLDRLRAETETACTALALLVASH